MIRLKAVMKPTLIAGGILLGILMALEAMQIVYRGPLANESALAYNKTFTLNVANYGIDYLSTQIVYSSASPATVSFTDGTQSTGSVTILSTSSMAGIQGTNSITVSTQASLTGATISIGGATLTEGLQWWTQTSTNAVATSIKTAINTYAPQFRASVGAQTNKVSIVCASSGTWCNSQTLTVSVSSLTAGGATFSGGVDNAILAINNITMIQGRDWNVGATSATTANAIATAINASSSLSSIVVATAPLSCVGGLRCGIVIATSTAVGTSTTYALFSSSNAVMSLSGSVTVDSFGRGTSAMTGGTASAVTLNSPIISKANTWTPNNPNQVGMVGLPVLYTTSTAVTISPLVWGTTYFVIPISQTQFELALTSTGAVAGTYITLTSTSAQSTAHTFVLTPLALAGSTTFSWQGSNDGTNWYSVGSSSAIASTGFTAGGTSIATDWGAYNYSYLKLLVTAPTAGGVAFTATANGRNTNR